MNKIVGHEEKDKNYVQEEEEERGYDESHQVIGHD